MFSRCTIEIITESSPIVFVSPLALGLSFCLCHYFYFDEDGGGDDDDDDDGDFSVDDSPHNSSSFSINNFSTEQIILYIFSLFCIGDNLMLLVLLLLMLVLLLALGNTLSQSTIDDKNNDKSSLLLPLPFVLLDGDGLWRGIPLA